MHKARLGSGWLKMWPGAHRNLMLCLPREKWVSVCGDFTKHNCRKQRETSVSGWRMTSHCKKMGTEIEFSMEGRNGRGQNAAPISYLHHDSCVPATLCVASGTYCFVTKQCSPPREVSWTHISLCSPQLGNFMARPNRFMPSLPRLLLDRHRCVKLWLLMRAEARSWQSGALRPHFPSLQGESPQERKDEGLFLRFYPSLLAGTGKNYHPHGWPCSCRHMLRSHCVCIELANPTLIV